MWLFLASWAMAPSALAGPHAEQQLLYGETFAPTALHRAALPPVTGGPNIAVYGYQAYWDADLNTVPWDDLSHLAVFSADASSTGQLSLTSRWDEAALAVSLAEPYGVKVHLCVTNFSTSGLETLLGNATYRQNLIDELVYWVGVTGAHGVNIDFEGLPSSRRNEMVQFTADLDAVIDEVVLATPAVDWSDAWDYAALTQSADLFIMGYGYHWNGSSQAGPSDPLYGGGPWSTWALAWSVDDYLAKGADPSRVILGLPLYGQSYPTADNEVPTDNIGSGGAIFMAEALAGAATYGQDYEPSSHSPYYYTGTNQIWHPTVDSVVERIEYVQDVAIGGFGFWALHYDDDDPALWGAIHDLTADPVETLGDDDDDATTTTTDPGVDVPFVAEVGLPFLAYVGDTVVLDGSASTGPATATLDHDWRQVGGPVVSLSDSGAAKPSFEVAEVGTLVFELVVGDGVSGSEPARTHVVVVDPDAGRRHMEGCGCSTGPSATGWLWLGLIGLCRRRR